MKMKVNEKNQLLIDMQEEEFWVVCDLVAFQTFAHFVDDKLDAEIFFVDSNRKLILKFINDKVYFRIFEENAVICSFTVNYSKMSVFVSQYWIISLFKMLSNNKNKDCIIDDLYTLMSAIIYEWCVDQHKNLMYIDYKEQLKVLEKTKERLFCNMMFM